MRTDWYDNVSAVARLYSMLPDSISRDMFWARLKVDLDFNVDNIHELLYMTQLYTEDMKANMMNAFAYIIENNKSDKRRPILVYGCGGAGRDYTKLLLQNGIHVDAYCDAKKFGQEFEGKVIISPKELFDSQNTENYLIIIAVTFQYYEAREFLIDHGISIDCIVPLFGGGIPSLAPLNQRGQYLRHPYAQYFEFLDFLPEKGAFIDVGCYQGETSIEFFSLLGNKADRYSVVGFEADEVNCRITKNELERSGISRYNIINAAVGEEDGVAEFVLTETSGSYLVTDEENVNVSRPKGDIKKIDVVAIDNCAIENAAFIKMDIEGAELSAIKGARNLIKRDKPMLSICVYHKAGDILAIMDYIHCLVPEYTFRLRHYSQYSPETVLYAFLEK